jgi:peptidoglycan/LPS O-acetylase OafA/YrhL
MLLYFLVWLLGAAFSRVNIAAGPLARTLFLLLFLALAVYYRIAGGNNHMSADTIVQDLAFGTALVLFLCSMRFRPVKAVAAERAHRGRRALLRRLFLHPLRAPCSADRRDRCMSARRSSPSTACRRSSPCTI